MYNPVIKCQVQFLFPRAMSQVPCLYEHKVSKLAWRMPRGSNTNVSGGHIQLCCVARLIPRQLAAGSLIVRKETFIATQRESGCLLIITVHFVHSNLCTEIAKQRFRACLSRVYHAETA